MPAEQPGADWPPPGRCYFCDSAPGRPTVWTCPSHRTFEAYALVVALRFVASWQGQPRPDSAEIIAWLASDEGAAAKETTGYLWPPNLSLMTSGLIIAIVRRSYDEGSLPRFEAVLLDGVERDRRLHEALDAVRAHCKKHRMRFSLEQADERGAIYSVTRGLLKRTTERVWLTVNDVGGTAQQLLASGSPAS
jgi:hypothetical protein